MRWRKFMMAVFTVLFGGLILGLAWIQRPSVCTNSKVVEKIDMSEGKNSVSIGRCRLGENPGYSQTMSETVQALDADILPLERFLENLRPFKNKLSLQINQDKSLVYKVTPTTFEVGSKLIDTDHLQRGFIKAWLLQGSSEFLTENQLVLETLTDIYLYSYRGDLKGFNPLTNEQQDIKDVPHWPLTLANLDTYCRSAWVVPEHIQTCSQKLKDFTLSKDSEVIDWSLRPFLSKVWISSLQSAELKDRKILLEKWSFASGGTKSNAGIEFEKLNPTLPATVYEELVVTSRNVLQSLSRWGTVGSLPAAFLKTLQQQIAMAGFQDSKNLPRFDFILKIDIPIASTDARLQEMKKISELYPHLNMAVQAGSQIWLLPNLTAVSTSTFPKIFTHQMIYESCHMSFGNLLEMMDVTEKILLIKSCHDSSPKKYWAFMNDGISGFALENPKTQFVHLHLPSLSLRKSVLNPVTDVFDALAQRDLGDPLYQALGWESLNWVEQYKAFHPKAQIEAIEWFRLF